MYKEMFYTEDLSNMTEELVFECIHKLILNHEKEFCQCDICVQDIAAIVLNNVPALYQCSFLEKINPREEQVKQIESVKEELKTHVLEAIDTVKKNSHH